jgi:hypothetical protein
VKQEEQQQQRQQEQQGQQQWEHKHSSRMVRPGMQFNTMLVVHKQPSTACTTAAGDPHSFAIGLSTTPAQSSKWAAAYVLASSFD